MIFLLTSKVGKYSTFDSQLSLTAHEYTMRIAVVGATGLVGQEIRTVLEESNLPIMALYPVASAASVGKPWLFKNEKLKVIGLEEAVALAPDFALFSAGGATSLAWAPKFSEAGTIVIDNSSAWRMNEAVPLLVPEVNFEALPKHANIIANPNCSTIQLVVALAPLHKAFGLKRVVVSTYQSVSGTGKAAMQQLEEEESGQVATNPAYNYPIYRNCIPHCDTFLENGYTKEEMKLVHESRKILGLPALRITATAVRVPVVGGHSESVNVTFEKPATVGDIRSVLAAANGVVLQDDPLSNTYPMPIHAHKKNDVFVGRIRADESEENAFNLWIVADNLRKGAATNAVQILEQLSRS